MKGTFVCVLVTLCILFSSCKNDRSVPLYNAWHELERTDFREGNEKFDHAVTAFKNELENEKNRSNTPHAIMKIIWRPFPTFKTGITRLTACL